MTLYYVQRNIRLEHLRGGSSHFTVGQYVDSEVDLGPGDENSPQFHDHVRRVPDGMTQEDFDALLEQEAAAEGAPKNIDVPYASAADTPPVLGTICNCTMGNWENEPSSYGYQWQRDGAAITGATASTYAIAAEDIDAPHALTCLVVATNDKGSTPALPSNAIATGPGAGTAAVDDDDEVEVEEVEEEDPHTGHKRTTTRPKPKKGRRY